MSDGHLYYHLPGRHVAGITNREFISSRSVNSSMAFLFLRVCNKHTEDYSSPLLQDRVFGIHSEYQNHDCGSSYSQDK